MVEQVIKDYGGLVFWQDTGNALIGPIADTWNDIAASGIWSTSTGEEIQTWTHPAVLAYLNVPQALWTRPNCNAAVIGINTQDARSMEIVTRPLLKCSTIRECVAPPASNRHNHRQDQAALTSYIYLGGYDCQHHSPIYVQVGDSEPMLDEPNCIESY